MTEILLGQNKITVDVRQRDDEAVALISSCLDFRYTLRLDAAGSFTARFPHSDEQVLHSLAVKSRLLYFYVEQRLEFAGVLESMSTAMGPDGRRMVTVTGRDLAAELAEQPVGFLELTDGAGNGVLNGPAQILAATTGGWTLETTGGFTTTLTPVYAKFAGESALSALIKIGEKIGEHFRIDATQRKVVWLRSSRPDSGIVAVASVGEPTQAQENPKICFIQQWAEAADGFDLATRIYPYGGGSGDTRLSLAAATDSAPAGYTLDTVANYIESDAADVEFGAPIHVYREFKDIRPISNTNGDLESAANYLLQAALAWLQLRDSGMDAKSYSLSVVGLAPTAVPGEEINVDYADFLYTAPGTLLMLEIEHAFGQSGGRNSKLSVALPAKRRQQEAAYLNGQLEAGQIYTTHPQIVPNSYEMPFRVFVGQNQTSDKAEVRFTFRDDVVQILQVLFRFTLAEVITTASTVSGASTTSGASSATTSGASNTTSSGASSATTSGASNTSSSGASSATTTAAGSSHNHTVTISSHTHTVTVTGMADPSTNPLARLVYIEADNDRFTAATGSGSDNAATSSSGGSSTPTSSSEATHTHNMPHTHTIAHDHNMPHTHNIAHDHNIPHTHTVTPNLTTDFGLFRESTANTYAIADLDYRVNGGSWLPLAGATLIAGDTYELDVTAVLCDAVTSRPNQENNLIEVRHDGAGGDKTVMLDVLLGIRTKIQSINYQ